ncbi:MAG: glycosyltransferase family 39 protein [Burkholderiales bacterium]|nr:glycosyltransferase family 39 protein [Burkholderiales bacterium]
MQLKDAEGPTPQQWLMLLGTALLLRLAFYSGFFGSDEVSYTEAAFRLLDGNWTVASYVGSNRYGVNLPMAAFGAVFGRGEWVAAAYSMICSLAEVALLAGLGGRLVGARAALLGAWLLALTPLHVNLAGRLAADAPMALTLTACFLLFFRAELQEASRGRAWGFLLAGLAAGWGFWIKPVAIYYLALFLLVPLLLARWRWSWLWLAVGFFAMVTANCALFALLSGDAMFLFKTMAERRASGYLEQELAGGAAMDAPWYYLVYLFGKVYHTLWLGLLAVWGLWATRRLALDPRRLLLLWALGLLVAFSLMPVGFKPFTWVPKQTNYMSLFLAPLSLLGGLALVAAARWVWAVLVPPALLLGALQQNQVTAFTANSKALVELVRAEPDGIYWVSTNALRAANFEALVREPLPQIRWVGDWTPGDKGRAFLDPQTLEWAQREPFRHLDQVPACWQRLRSVQGRPEGIGPWVLQQLPLPGVIQERLRVAPAVLYSLEAC